MMAFLFDGIDAHGRTVRLYVSAASRIDERTFRVEPGAVITWRLFGEPRGRGRPLRRWDIAVKAARMSDSGARGRDVQVMVNEYLRAARRSELTDPRDPLSSRPERPHYRAAARWAKAGRQFQEEVRRRGYLEFSLRGGTWEAFIVKDGERRGVLFDTESANGLLMRPASEDATGRRKPQKAKR